MLNCNLSNAKLQLEQFLNTSTSLVPSICYLQCFLGSYAIFQSAYLIPRYQKLLGLVFAYCVMPITPKVRGYKRVSINVQIQTRKSKRANTNAQIQTRKYKRPNTNLASQPLYPQMQTCN